MKTLVIDAEEAIKQSICGIFADTGACDGANDGNMGLELIKQAFEISQPYALIILDIVLPEIDGHTIIKQIRQWEIDRGIDTLNEAKILVVSRRRDEPTILRAFRNGATGWISKPVAMEEIVHKLNNLKCTYTEDLAKMGPMTHPPLRTRSSA